MVQISRVAWAKMQPMLSPEWFTVSVLKALVEVAGMALLAQGLVGLFAGATKDRNVIYQMFRMVTAPVTRLVRWIVPANLVDRYLGWVSFCLLLGLWIALIFAKRYVCDIQHLACLPS
jgi:hypothetical protein